MAQSRQFELMWKKTRWILLMLLVRPHRMPLVVLPLSSRKTIVTMQSSGDFQIVGVFGSSIQFLTISDLSDDTFQIASHKSTSWRIRPYSGTILICECCGPLTRPAMQAPVKNKEREKEICRLEKVKKWLTQEYGIASRGGINSTAVLQEAKRRAQKECAELSWGRRVSTILCGAKK
ncbi:uncharacterized protein ARMOST_22444 [Armillaria ostoyae]|uniref:Uncharacterized protein n=1 Tax=Armillaria ostoyae TaxID=47428 RepID=A0A284SCV9_ARMOS|nr:uncharacterized protein ARMOST_22444 [Armillaria ostoyae]